MTQIVVVSGNPRPGSRTRTLATAVGAAIAARSGAAAPAVVDVGLLGTGLLHTGEPATGDAEIGVTDA